ncbi:amidohydrolase [Xanthovirga aplysinae]|uniref:amidohydrolase n=1 Tax=Xanthovirga aplysinae TaxID=2529853 RepID=UPI0012BCEBAC|nr:amidohydrolase [Xanthovirga aplysinae]MTI29895.1 amidohydrolase [Xanthovirga aplysinae]
MKKALLFLVSYLGVITLIFGQQETPNLVGADLIVYNAKITTQNPAQPQASALAVKKGRIYAVGKDAEIRSLKDENTFELDAKGQRLLPGLNDAHMHVLMGSNTYNFDVRWDGVPTLKEALQMLKEQAKRTPKGHWVKVIGGWSPYQFEEKRLPTLKELEKAVPNHPFIIQYAYNVAFLNKEALDAIGADRKDFWVPPFTKFERDKKGRLTGRLYGEPGSIMFWVLEVFVPQPTLAERKNSLQQLLKELNRLGLTSVIDAGGSGYPQQHAVIQQLVAEDKLPLRFSFTDIGDGNLGMEEIEEELNSITRLAPISPGQNLHPNMEHGYEYEGVGEAIRVSMLDYENFDRPAHILDPNHIKEVITKDVGKLVKRRIPFRIHATYNENLTAMLDALEELNQEMPFDGLRWGIEHAEFISPENISRIKNLGGGITIQDKMAFHGDAFIKTYGKEKALQTPPFREILDQKVPLTLGTDGIRVASFNPWISIYWAVSGKAVSGTEVLAEENRLSREEALRLYTIGSAWFQDDENEKGRIAPGQLADFILLNKDYLEIPESEIPQLHAILTVVDGKVVYGEGEYSKYAPVIPKPIPAWSPVNYFPGHYSGWGKSKN